LVVDLVHLPHLPRARSTGVRRRHDDLTRWRPDSGTPRDTTDHCVRRLLPRDYRAYARFDSPATARCWIQRALCALAAHSLSGKPDHHHLRVVAELAGWRYLRPEAGISGISGPHSVVEPLHRVRASSR